ncbi:MAG: TIGR02302 family protein [Rhodomicrobium sp.]
MMTKIEEPKDAQPGAKPDFTPEERLLERKVRAAKLTLLFEKLWPRVWLPAGIAGVFVLLSIFEVWPLLPPRIHFALLCAFGAAFALSFLPLILWRRPPREASFARLEQASALEHRPLTAFNDTLLQENPSPEMLALWEAHRAHAAQALKKLKAGAPNARVDKYDPFALRAALVLMLVAAGSWAWGDLGSRLRAAFIVPEVPAGAGFRIDAWISPPAYTRKEPFVLPEAASKSKEAIAVPQGSQLTVKINGTDAAEYHVALADGDVTQALEPAGQSVANYAEYTSKIEKSATLSVHRSFGADRSWILNAVPDLPPKIAFSGPIEVSPRGVMLMKYKVEDDYGVTSAEARIERFVAPAAGSGGNQASPQIGKPPVFPLSLPRPPVRAGDAKTYRDLTAHPWAGLPVVVTLVAKDEAGHEGLSAPRGLILPERKFTKALAKAIIGQRRALVENPSDTFRIASNLNALAISGADEGLATEVYLNLRSAYWRLRGRLSVEDVENVADQLWDAAIRIEDGNLSSAERELRAAQDRLKDALERGASPEEIQKLMSELRQALNHYMEALLQQQQSGKSSQAATSPNAKTVSPQDLERMLNRIESLAKAGSPEAAAQMLNELRDILESVQAGSPNSSASQRENAEKLKQLNRLTDIMRQQQQLLDKTFRAQQGSDSNQSGGDREQQQGGTDSKTAAGLKKRQEELQKQLQDLLSAMKPGKEGDNAQQKLKDAEAAMGEAAGSLEQNDLGEAGDQEGRALDAMRQGSRSMAEGMAQASGQGNGNGQANRDPLGRRQGRQLDNGDSVKVPDEITVQQARRILDELRKRLGEPERPPVELDYLERLVKPY